ncbi:MAG TPA: hypothetical protein VK558_17200 [Patescibacteria group bacterium]|nr:hypothetical protein [Patescibacteria group bacterium]
MGRFIACRRFMRSDRLNQSDLIVFRRKSFFDQIVALFIDAPMFDMLENNHFSRQLRPMFAADFLKFTAVPDEFDAHGEFRVGDFSAILLAMAMFPPTPAAAHDGSHDADQEAPPSAEPSMRGS